MNCTTSELVSHGRAFEDHWFALASGGAIVFLWVTVLPWLLSAESWPWNKAMPVWLRWSLVVGSVAIAQYRVWRDIHRSHLVLEAKVRDLEAASTRKGSGARTAADVLAGLSEDQRTLLRDLANDGGTLTVMEAQETVYDGCQVRI